jgi:hypothetical protein
MKNFIFLLVALFFAVSVNAQLKQEVISSAGGYNVNGGLSVSWTLGETIIPTFRSQDGTMTLTHGFQQKMIVTSVEENLDLQVDIKIYPNPASDIVNIQFGTPVDGEVVLSLLDSQGKLVKRDIIESAVVEKQINLQDFPPGIYFIKLTKGKLVNVYKVVKL